MLSVLLAASWLAASTWKEGWIRCWSHCFPCGARLPLPLLPSPDVSTSSPRSRQKRQGQGALVSPPAPLQRGRSGDDWSVMVALNHFLRHRVISPELPSAGPGGLLLVARSCCSWAARRTRDPPRLVGSRHPRLRRATQTRFSPLQFLSLQTSSKPQFSAIRPSAPSFSSSKCSPPAD